MPTPALETLKPYAVPLLTIELYPVGAGEAAASAEGSGARGTGGAVADTPSALP